AVPAIRERFFSEDRLSQHVSAAELEPAVKRFRDPAATPFEKALIAATLDGLIPRRGYIENKVRAGAKASLQSMLAEADPDLSARAKKLVKAVLSVHLSAQGIRNSREALAALSPDDREIASQMIREVLSEQGAGLPIRDSFFYTRVADDDIRCA